MRVGRNWFRLLGLPLLAFILWRADAGLLANLTYAVTPYVLVAALLLNGPHVLLKVVRWRGLLRSQGIDYGIRPASLSYLSSIFVGLVTPGRLGDFSRVLHVTRDCGAPMARAFSTVLVDRLFDLYAILLVGGAAVVTLGTASREVRTIGLVALAAFLILPLVVLLNGRVFRRFQALGSGAGPWGRKLLAPGGWIPQLRDAMLELTLGSLVRSAGLTILAYSIFFGQCKLLAVAMDLSVSFAQSSYAVALGSLVTFLPVSIAGLGTREAVIVAYLGTVGVTAEPALAFSVLVFLTFYVAFGLAGAVAWWIKPVTLPLPWRSKSQRAGHSEVKC